VTELLDLDHPTIQGPFGGGLSSVELAAAVSNAGGLGSFDAQPLTPAEVSATVGELRAATRGSFAMNLWVSTHDLAESEMTRERFEVAPPAFPERPGSDFDTQFAAMLEARPPAFSFVFGVPDAAKLDACRDAGIVTIGTAITVAEAVALDDAGVDIIVASGFEAGGHRVAFLDTAEESLVGTIALIPAVVDQVRAPVVAAGGIADQRGIAAALALGAEGVQIGSAFLATDESAAPAAHRTLSRATGQRHTRLTRAFSGRLARGIPNQAMELVDADPALIQPYPYQGHLIAPMRAASIARRDCEGLSLWAG